MLGAAACGSSSTSAKPATPSGGGAIAIMNFMFTPNPLQAKVGDAITVTNKDGTNHTATADDRSFDTQPFSSGSKTIHLTKAGTVNFHCDIHNFMHGVIQVSP
jgi:plastocyanin